jgi:hypothetical protein
MIVVLRFSVLDCSLHADSLTLSMQASCSVESWLLKNSLVTCSAVDPPHPSKLSCSIEQHSLTAMLHTPGKQQQRQQAQAGSRKQHCADCSHANMQLTEAPAKADSCTAHDTQPPSASEQPRPLRLCALQAAPYGKAQKIHRNCTCSCSVSAVSFMQQVLKVCKVCDLKMMCADPCCSHLRHA